MKGLCEHIKKDSSSTFLLWQVRLQLGQVLASSEHFPNWLLHQPICDGPTENGIHHLVYGVAIVHENIELQGLIYRKMSQ
jgi:hypothetical protein